MSEHAWVLEHVASYAAGGLDADECERLENHVVACASCAAALDETRQLDQSLDALFADERPDPALEDRVIHSLRQRRLWRKSRLPMVFRIAIASAAVLLVGIVGAAASQIVLEGELPLPGAARTLRSPDDIASTLLSARQRALHESPRFLEHPPAMAPEQEVEGLVEESRRKVLGELSAPDLGDTSRFDINGVDRANDLGNYPPSRALNVKGTSRVHTHVGGPLSSGGEQAGGKEDGKRGEAGQVGAGGVAVSQAELRAAEARREEAKFHLDRTKKLSAHAAISQEEARAAELTYERYKLEAEAALKRHTVEQEARDKQLGAFGRPMVAVPEPPAPRPSSGSGRLRLPEGETPRTPATGTMGRAGAAGPSQGGGKGNGDSKNGRMYYSYSDNRPAPVFTAPPSPASPAPSAAGGAAPGAGAPPTTFGLMLGSGGPGQPGTSREAMPKSGKPGDGYFRPDDAAQKAGEKATGKEAPSGEGKGEGRDPKAPPGKSPPMPKGGDDANNKPRQDGEGLAPSKPEPDKQAAGPRKIIIRSGDIEFEIESFDSAVATVTKLVNAIPGGFVATVNSEKLPNGKVRGSAVVRVPPEHLDGLVLDLRKELGKSGELKGQRIGSQDITKQYTDLESRLKAARAMEERLLRIIKEGKGEIKDLLLAEKELGVWRTKIEETEGELRYYSQLVALSTLTVTMYEKEIRAPAALVITERVNMGIEVEDVEKALRAALAAVKEAKGRVTRSDLKQHAAGQLQAQLTFEVAPDASGPLRDRLAQLGTVTRRDVDTVTKAEGGTGRAGEVPSRFSDAQFSVSLYNVANIAPRETLQIQLAAPDAEAAYKAILARVEKAGGRVVTSNLNRQRADQTAGTISFEVKSAEADAVLLDLRTEGEVLNLQVTENPDTQNVTRAKRGFAVQILSLYNAAAVPPFTTVQLNVAATDAEEAYKAVLARVEKAGGRVVSSSLNRQRNDQTQGTIHFEVKSTEAETVLPDLRALGEVMRLQSTENTGAQNVARTKRGFQVQVWALGAVAPRETASVQLATKDVPAAYKALQEAITKSQGRILNAQLNEQDKQNITGTLEFDVRRSEEAALEAALAKAGTALARSVIRAQDSDTVVDTKVGYKVTVTDVNRLAPREMFTLALEVPSVEQTQATLEGLAGQARGRQIERKQAQTRTGEVTARVVYDVPLAESSGFVDKVKTLGTLRVYNADPNPQVPVHPLATARVEVVLVSVPPIVPKDDGVGPQVRQGLTTSVKWIGISLMWAVVGVSVVLPWALIVYGIVRLVIWLTRRREPAATVG